MRGRAIATKGHGTFRVAEQTYRRKPCLPHHILIRRYYEKAGIN
jgi:hypothetical protein